MKWLFYVAKGYSIPVVDPLVIEGSKQGVDMAFYVSARVAGQAPEHWRKFAIFQDIDEAIAFDPDFVLCPGNFVDFRLPGLKVELFHGIGIEKPVHYHVRHFFDIYCTSGPVVTQRFEAVRARNPYFRVIETGWPKIDHIVNYNTTDLAQKLDIPEGKTVVLYAPTHSRRMQSAEALLPHLEGAMKPGELWVLKPHELTDKDVLARLAALGSERVRVIRDPDITPWLHAAQVMISDTSSVIYEFMALDKPVITYRTLDRKDKGIDIQSPAELRPALDEVLADPEAGREIRERHLAEVNPRVDGSVASTVYKALAAVKPGEAMGPGRKPLNLFRKAQVLYHSRFKKGYIR